MAITDNQILHARSRAYLSRRLFTWHTVLTSAAGQIIGTGGYIFVAFLLCVARMPARYAGLLVMCASLPAVTMPWSPSLFAYAAKHRRRMMVLGYVEALCMLAPFFILYNVNEAGAAVFAAGIAIFTGMFIQQIMQGTVSLMIASQLSDAVRPKITRRLWYWSQTAAALTAIGAGPAIYLHGNGYQTYMFAVVAACIATIAGYTVIGSLRPSAPVIHEPVTAVDIAALPFRKRDFGRLILMRALTYLPLSMMFPHVLVLLVAPDALGCNLIRVALAVALLFAGYLAGFGIWQHIVHLYGPTPVLKTSLMLIIPTACAWAFIDGERAILAAPLAFISGFFQSGITVPSRNLLYGSIPDSENVQSHLLSWNTWVGISAAAGPLCGSLILTITPEVMTGLRTVFLVSGVLLTLPLAVSFGIPRAKDRSVRYVIRQFSRGNPLMFAYRTFDLVRATSGDARARAINALARTGSPLAEESLLEALDDIDPDVRKSAANGLIRTATVSAEERLIRELKDGESDIRFEVCQTLGNVGTVNAVPVLNKMLDDDDTRLRIAAVDALAGIGGEQAREVLANRFYDEPYDHRVFPALADAISRYCDTGIVEPVMSHLEEFTAPAYRLQLLNAVCRVLGAGTLFYRIMSHDEYRVTDEINSLIKSTRRRIGKYRQIDETSRKKAREILKKLEHSFRRDDHEGFLAAAWNFSAFIQLAIPANPAGHREIIPYIEAINRFLSLKKVENIQLGGIVFIIICINRLSDVLTQYSDEAS